MANGKDNNGSNETLTRFYVAIAVALTTILGGNSYLVRQATVTVDAPDRYTGTQGRALERRVDALEQRNGRLDEHLQNHPDHALRLSLSEALIRIGQLEIENERLRKQIDGLKN